MIGKSMPNRDAALKVTGQLPYVGDMKMQGIGVLFVSSEMPEVMGIADRILVMCDGRITGELNPDTTTQNEILEYATRFESKVQKIG